MKGKPNMQSTDNKLISKPAILAQLIYKAIVRYVKAKKSPEITRKSNFRLDSRRIWRGNTKEIIDRLEK